MHATSPATRCRYSELDIDGQARQLIPEEAVIAQSSDLTWSGMQIVNWRQTLGNGNGHGQRGEPLPESFSEWTLNLGGMHRMEETKWESVFQVSSNLPTK